MWTQWVIFRNKSFKKMKPIKVLWWLLRNTILIGKTEGLLKKENTQNTIK